MQTVVNPVQVVSDFLKSPDGEAMRAALAETGRVVEIGVVNKDTTDSALIVFGGDGFRARTNDRERPAHAYDVFDAVMEQPSGDEKAGEAFLRAVTMRYTTLPT